MNPKPAVQGLLAATLLAGVLLFQGCSPSDVKVSADAPTAVAKGERFEIRATVLNTAKEQQVLRDLDIADAYLEGRSGPPCNVRFDIVGVCLEGAHGVEIEHIRSAFEA